jgi:hypothetical protein
MTWVWLACLVTNIASASSWEFLQCDTVCYPLVGHKEAAISLELYNIMGSSKPWHRESDLQWKVTGLSVAVVNMCLTPEVGSFVN